MHSVRLGSLVRMVSLDSTQIHLSSVVGKQWKAHTKHLAFIHLQTMTLVLTGLRQWSGRLQQSWFQRNIVLALASINKAELIFWHVKEFAHKCQWPSPHPPSQNMPETCSMNLCISTLEFSNFSRHGSTSTLRQPWSVRNNVPCKHAATRPASGLGHGCLNWSYGRRILDLAALRRFVLPP